MVSANAAAPRSNDDIPLVLRAIRRDQDAFGELYDRHVVRVYRHIYRSSTTSVASTSPA